MVHFHLKSAFRNLYRRWSFSFLNIAGLALGMAVCLLIAIYAIDESSFDRFHENADRIYRLTTHAVVGENEWNAAIVSPALATVLTEEIPEVERVVRLDLFNKVVVKNEDQVFSENRVLAADNALFEVFTFPLAEGEPATALLEPYTVVITRSIADKYFGKNEAALGNILTIDDQPYRVTGILEPVPQNSHFHFDIAFSFNSLRKGRDPRWENTNTTTYVLMKPGHSAEILPGKLDAVQRKYNPDYAQMIEAGYSWQLRPQLLTDIHLHSHLEDELEPNGDIRNVYLFGLIALFILLIACVNYLNLTTARSADRAREVGIRKTLGAGRNNMIGQFLTESVIVSLLAMILAVGLSEALRGPFSSIAGRDFGVRLLESPVLVGGVLLVTLVVALLAGSYPAFFLSRFQPVEVLRGALATGSRNSLFRNVLVVFQFVISISLITATFLVYRQLQFMQQAELGVDRQNVVVIRNGRKLGDRADSFRDALQGYSRVKGFSHSSAAPFEEYEGSYFLEKGKNENERRLLNFLRVGYDYLPTLGITLQEGRNFSRAFAGDTAAVILNETAVGVLGMNDPIGKLVLWGDQPLEVVGVVRDYHYRSLHQAIGPLALLPSAWGDNLEVRIDSDDVANTLAWLESQWHRHLAGTAPFEYTFLDADYDALFRAEQRVGRLFGAFALLAILIACLGLFGLAAFMAERRAKEIGIRKVFGASTARIIQLLTRDFTRLVIIALVIAIPLAYWSMNQWLNGFAYRVPIGWENFALAGGLALLIAWLTVGFLSFRAAVANPVDTLKEE